MPGNEWGVFLSNQCSTWTKVSKEVDATKFSADEALSATSVDS